MESMLARLAKLCLLPLVLSGALEGQEAQSKKPENPPSEGSCSVAGLVVKLGSGEPLKKAEVYLQKVDDQESGYSAHTDATGHFAIRKIDPGRYYLRVQRSGYVSQLYGENSSSGHGAVLALSAGHEIQDLLFRLAPWAIISGRITDEDGDPISGVQVSAMHHYFIQGKRTLETQGAAETNDLGEFRLYGLSKGRYLIRAQIEVRWQRALRTANPDDPSSAAQTGYAPIYYPGTSDQSRAAVIDVAPGQEIPAIDFTLIPVRTFRVRGHVFNAVLGQPAKNCIVMLIRHDPNVSAWHARQGETDCNKGSFELNDVVPGTYSLIVILSSSGKQHSSHATVEVDNTNVDDVRINVGPGIDLTGRILVEGHKALDFSEVQLFLHDPEQDFNGNAGAVIKPDGSLLFEGVPEGTFQMRVWSQAQDFSDFYLKAARANGEDILEKGLTVGAGSARGPVDVVLSSAGSRIEGTVTDDNDLPSAGAVVALVPEGKRDQFRLYKDTTTDQYGQFVLRGIAPGNYKIFSWREVESNAWEDPDFLAPFESKGTGITAEENGHVSITLKLIPTDKFRQSP
jgi:protocatechuate 3,4-dioxygenase beta subunit/5-hydroxyisourate hydrolase-like protein (transthyretin family)